MSDRDEIDCEHCGKTVATWGYSNHVRDRHGATVACPTCGQKFLTTPDMRQHYDSKHRGTR